MNNLVKLEREPDEKDGDDTEFSAINLEVETVDNGWILKVTDEDDTEYTEVFRFDDAPHLMEAIKEALGC